MPVIVHSNAIETCSYEELESACRLITKCKGEDEPVLLGTNQGEFRVLKITCKGGVPVITIGDVFKG